MFDVRLSDLSVGGFLVAVLLAMPKIKDIVNRPANHPINILRRKNDYG